MSYPNTIGIGNGRRQMDSEETESNLKPTGCVLLADSHPEMLKGVYQLLSSIFSTVVMVSDQEALIKAATALSPEVIVMDISLPGRTAGNIVKRIVAEAGSTGIVVLVMQEQPHVIREILAAGAKAVVSKSSAGTDLIPAASNVLQGINYVSPSIVNSLKSIETPGESP